MDEKEVEQKKWNNEEKLDDFQNQFNLLFMEMDSAFALHRMVYDKWGKPVDYIFIDVNPAFEKHTGLKREALIGRRVMEVMPNTELYWIETYGQVALTGEHIRFENYSAVLDRYYDISAYSPRKDYFAVIFRDITTIKKYELQLKEANEEYLATNEELEETLTNLREINEKYKEAKEIAEENEAVLSVIFNSAPVIMMLLNDQTEIETMNATGLTSTGNSENSVKGLRGGDVFHCVGTINNPAGCGKGEICKNCRVRGTVEECLKTGQPVLKQEAEIISVVDGTFRTSTVMVSATPIRRNNQKFVLVTIDDISERKAMEVQLRLTTQKAEESDRLKSAFLANMSHEIRTPLNGILGFTDLLVTKPDLSDAQRALFSTVIKRSSASLLQIINDILDISRIESGELDLKISEFTISGLINDMFTIFSKKIEEANKSITLEKVIQDTSVVVKADEMRLRQVFSNLLDNAVKFTPSGNISFGLTGMGSVEGKVGFFVRDTGIGIHPQQHSIIFDRFRQGQETFNRNFGGNGLGLSIVKSLLEMMGGSIRLESGPGEGALFYFSLPAGRYPKSATSLITEERNGGSIPANRRVLLVEDDPASQLYLEELLIGTPYTLTISGMCNDALRRMASGAFDIILMDIQLPDGNGLDLVRKIRETYPSVYIIAQTAYAMVSDEKRALEAGCNDYISKPLNAKLLFEKLRKA